MNALLFLNQWQLVHFDLSPHGVNYAVPNRVPHQPVHAKKKKEKKKKEKILNIIIRYKVLAIFQVPLSTGQILPRVPTNQIRARTEVPTKQILPRMPTNQIRALPVHA